VDIIFRNLIDNSYMYILIS